MKERNKCKESVQKKKKKLIYKTNNKKHQLEEQ